MYTSLNYLSRYLTQSTELSTRNEVVTKRFFERIVTRKQRRCFISNIVNWIKNPSITSIQYFYDISYNTLYIFYAYMLNIVSTNSFTTTDL